MRTIAITLCAAALLAGCASTPDGKRAISARIEGAGGRTLFFDRWENGKPLHVDSVTLDGNGAGTLHVPRLPLDFYRIALSDAQQMILALDSTEEVSIEAKADSMMTPTKVSGSAHCEALHAFYGAARRYEDETGALRARFGQGDTDPSAMARLDQLNGEYRALCLKTVQENPGSPVALAAVSKLNIQQDLPLFTQLRDDLKSTMGGSAFYMAFRDNVDRMKQQEEARKMQEQQQQRLSNLLPVGGEAPEIRQNTPDGGTFALSELRGKVVLVDFWASWCRPCRMENPAVVAAYNKYKSKGFDILGVSLDRDATAWKNAIAQDGLMWHHISDLQWWNNAAAQTYGVSSIPFSILLDRDGKVIDKNLRGEALDRKLAEVLGS